ncbi:MAG: hypothetical protein HKN11_12205, partial [Rhizobiales bacterium]|nr:hypothetical protein [Hyphomicrobiales bacterium]
DLGGIITSGLFQSLASDGALMLETDDGAIHTIRAGDVIRSVRTNR